MDVNAGRLSLGLSPKAGAVGGRDETDNHVSSRLTENSHGRPHTSRRSQLFNPLPRRPGPTGGRGKGLGLSISWDIVSQQHGGSIDVASCPGEFTEFTIRLPRNGQAVSPEAAG
jgi:nitrogen-specific signal transduction histidine kinase